jgi:NitT/TauT family transport system substrate-binding protein
MKRVLLKSALTLLCALAPLAAQAETSVVRIAKQFGVSYLPLTLMESEKLIEKHAKAEGLEVTTEWTRFTGGGPMNDAILSGNLDFASGGVGPFLTIWGKTRTNIGVKAVAGLNWMPLDLVTNNPKVKTIADFTDKDRIALPTAKTSIQAVTLQMAAAKAFGADKATKLDSLEVSMGHPDAMAALLGGHSEITAHFGSEPFQTMELADPKVHKVLDSYDVLGGPHTFNLVWASSKFADANPKVMKAFRAALEEAIAQIKKDPAKVASIYMATNSGKITKETIEKIITDPKNAWTTQPKKLLAYLDFLNSAGRVAAKTDKIGDLFFPGLDVSSGD